MLGLRWADIDLTSVCMSRQDGVVELRPLWFTNQLIRAVPRSAFAPEIEERIPAGIFDQLVIRLGGLLRYVPVANLPSTLRWQQVVDFSPTQDVLVATTFSEGRSDPTESHERLHFYQLLPEESLRGSLRPFAAGG
ncbi:MAG: hypothetical protein ABI862_06175 [Ilumatobacteraceae bacterium]